LHYYNAGLAKSCYTALKIPSSIHPRASSITTTPSLKQHLHCVKPPLTLGLSAGCYTHIISIRACKCSRASVWDLVIARSCLENNEIKWELAFTCYYILYSLFNLIIFNLFLNIVSLFMYLLVR